MSRLALLVFSLDGGAGKMMVNLARGLASLGHTLDLVYADAGKYAVGALPAAVTPIEIRARRVWGLLLPVTRYLHKSRPDVLLSTVDTTNVVAVMSRALSSTRTRLVLREANNLSQAWSAYGWIKRTLVMGCVRLTYPLADSLVAVSNGVAQDLAKILGLPMTAIRVVPNPVITQELRELAKEQPEHAWFGETDIPIVMGVGRLVKVKDFETLIRAFALVRAQRVVRLVVVGDGPELNSLHSLCGVLGVARDCAFLGFAANPYKYIARARVVVSSSRKEGSPNVLVEAMALGVAVVSTDCPSGPAEILQGGLYGELVPVGDVEELARAIVRAMDRKPNSDRVSGAVAKYSVVNAVSQYADVMGVVSTKNVGHECT